MMTVNITVKPVRVMNIESSDQKLSSLAQQVENLKGEINGAKSSGDVQSIINKLRGIEGRIPLGLAGTAPLQALISKTLEAAEKRKLEEQAQEEAVFAAMMKEVMSSAFCYGVCKHMTETEKEFFNSFVPGQKYDIYEWKNGEYVLSRNAGGGATEVDGAQLREDFARIKYHALNDEQKEQVGKPPGAASEAEEMDQLKESLDRMEGYQGGELVKKGASKAECRRCHDKFERARGQADLVAQGQGDKKELRRLLQEEIINETLVPSQSGGRYAVQEASHKEPLKPTPLPAAPPTPSRDRILS